MSRRPPNYMKIELYRDQRDKYKAQLKKSNDANRALMLIVVFLGAALVAKSFLEVVIQ